MKPKNSKEILKEKIPREEFGFSLDLKRLLFSTSGLIIFWLVTGLFLNGLLPPFNVDISIIFMVGGGSFVLAIICFSRFKLLFPIGVLFFLLSLFSIPLLFFVSIYTNYIYFLQAKGILINFLAPPIVVSISVIFLLLFHKSELLRRFFFMFTLIIGMIVLSFYTSMVLTKNGFDLGLVIQGIILLWIWFSVWLPLNVISYFVIGTGRYEMAASGSDLVLSILSPVIVGIGGAIVGAIGYFFAPFFL